VLDRFSFSSAESASFEKNLWDILQTDSFAVVQLLEREDAFCDWMVIFVSLLMVSHACFASAEQCIRRV